MAGEPEAGDWTDKSYLRTVQYRDPSNLLARQSIYSFQVPRVDLPAWALDLARPVGSEVVADVGCGNGAYLAELARRRHQGHLVGIDLSQGMVSTVRSRLAGPILAVADAVHLPLRGGSVDLALAMHMLYHASDRRTAVRELRRLTAPDGQVLVVLNGADHLAQLRGMLETVFGAIPIHRPVTESLRLDDGHRLLDAEFDEVARHDVRAQLVITSAEPVVQYVLSMNVVKSGLLDEGEVRSLVGGRVEAAIARDGAFKVTTHSGCLVCR